jgi:hypothetical protein
VPKKLVRTGVDLRVDRFERGGRGMNRIRFIILLSAMVVGMAVPVVAKATGSTGSSSVYIQDKADYDFVGTNLDVGLVVTCSDSTKKGSVVVRVDQYPPATPYPVGKGSGPQIVVCDGRPHSVGVTIIGAGFDAGPAKATATLTTPTNSRGNKTVTKWITIVVV